MSGLAGPKRKQEMEPERVIRPQVALDDLAIQQITSSVPQLGFGYCPHCGIEGVLYRCPSSHIHAMMTGVGALSSELREHVESTMSCTLCEIGKNPDARVFATYRGYLWYLIGKPDSTTQVAINRTLWRAATQSLSRFREGERARLRNYLAQCPPGRDFQIPDRVLPAVDQELANRAIQEVLDQTALRQAYLDDNRSAIIGTIGMHHLLENAERGQGEKLAWFGNERYFVTVRGLERLHEGLPLGHDPEEVELALLERFR